MKNYYQILNVKPTATEEEIKRSYRILAKRYHPDVNPGDSTAAEKFSDINEAHDTLSDPQKRAEYDNKLKEASAPKPKPEDIIARQRAAAQAAARQAAMRNSAAARQTMMQQNAARQAAMRNSAAARAAAYRRDPTMNVAQQRAAAQAAAAAAQAAQIHAAQSQAQAQAQNMRAQMTAIKNQAYAQGYDRGVADTKATADKEKARLEADITALNADIQALNDKIAETEHDRNDLEQELFNRDRELSKTKSYTLELEQQIEILRDKLAAVRPNKHSDSDYDALRQLYEKAQAQIRTLETEKTQEELKAKAQIQLQTDKRKQIQEQASKLQKQVAELTHELEVLRTENNQWQDYAKSEQFISDAEERLQEWDKKQKADKKLAKPTLYGLLGVLIWASDEEISEAYVKLGKRLSGKGDDSKEKLQKITDAYAILSNPKKRAEYNNSIGITEERIEKERRLIEENAAIEQEYRRQLDNKEFWAKFDELSFNAQTGDPDAQNSLGELYYFGDEIEQDYDHAVFWFKEAAKQKHAEAMYNLGICFMNGEGVEKNKSTGLGFVRQAAKLGSDSAIQYLKKNNV